MIGSRGHYSVHLLGLFRWMLDVGMVVREGSEMNCQEGLKIEYFE